MKTLFNKTIITRPAVHVLLLSYVALIFSFGPRASAVQPNLLHQFGTNSMGLYPDSPLTRGQDGSLYGMTSFGGSANRGQIYKINSDGSGYIPLADFAGSNGIGSEAVMALSGATLYGTTQRGGEFDEGTIFKVNVDGSGFAVLHSFSALSNSESGFQVNLDGAGPLAGLVISDGWLFGAAYEGGTNGSGTIFKISSKGTDYSVLHTFSDHSADSNAEGLFPTSRLLIIGDYLYGTASLGGTNAAGTIFKARTDGSEWTVLHHFGPFDWSDPDLTNLDGEFPFAGLLESGGILYGTCGDGGAFGLGTVYKLNPDGSDFAVLKAFDGAMELGHPDGSLVVSGAALFGTTTFFPNGTIYKLNTDGSNYCMLKYFTNWVDGSSPSRGLVVAGTNLYGTTGGGGLCNYGALFALGTDGSSYRVLTNFAGGDGASPQGDLLAVDNTLYGSTWGGGKSGSGTLFRVNRDGSDYELLHDFVALFNGSTYINGEGAWPNAGLLLSGLKLYGTTRLGGPAGNGTIFRIGTNGQNHEVLYAWSATTTSGPTTTATNADGALPNGGLAMLGANLYGTAREGGRGGSGVVFRIDTIGSDFDVLHSFAAVSWGGSSYINADGANPNGRLAFCGSNLFGTTEYGGAFGWGTVFRIDCAGTNFVVLKHFQYEEGYESAAGLLLSGSMLYGSTYQDRGGSPQGTVYRIDTDGGRFDILKQFQGDDGASPAGELALAGSTIFGTTERGGLYDSGVVFQLKTNGNNFAVLAHFDGTNGANPNRALVCGEGSLYGVCGNGGNMNGGVLFQLSLPRPVVLAPLLTQTAEAGSAVRFSVRLEGDPPFTYRWFFNETNALATSGSALQLNSVQMSDSGRYAVAIIDPTGAATNSEASLSVIAPVPRRLVPALRINGEAGSLITLESSETLFPSSTWQILESVPLTGAPQYCFDTTVPLPNQRYYRASQSTASGTAPALDLPFMVPAITLGGSIGNSIRLDYINAIGPTDAWTALATITLTNTSQLFFDLAAPGQPARLYRTVDSPLL
jgi:uncharacterized repeat protein (TIGR03803 family)